MPLLGRGSPLAPRLVLASIAAAALGLLGAVFWQREAPESDHPVDSPRGPPDQGAGRGTTTAADTPDENAVPGRDPATDPGALPGPDRGDRDPGETSGPAGTSDLPLMRDVASAMAAMRILHEEMLDTFRRERRIRELRRMLEEDPRAVAALVEFIRASAGTNEREAHNAIVVLGRTESPAARDALRLFVEDASLPESLRIDALEGVFGELNTKDGVDGILEVPYLSGGFRKGRRPELLPWVAAMAEKGTSIRKLDTAAMNILAENQRLYEESEENPLSESLYRIYAKAPWPELKMAVVISLRDDGNYSRKNALFALEVSRTESDVGLRLEAVKTALYSGQHIEDPAIVEQAEDALIDLLDETDWPGPTVQQLLTTLSFSPRTADKALDFAAASYKRYLDTGRAHDRKLVASGLRGYGSQAIPLLNNLITIEPEETVRAYIQGVIDFIHKHQK